MSNPTILVVPGSFAPETTYHSTILHLRSLGFPAAALRMPSTTKRMPLPPASMLDDADVIRRSVEAVTATGKEVVVVCHSYGGTPTTQALAGIKGVKRVVYLAAIVPRVGETTHGAMTGTKGEMPMSMEMTVSLHVSVRQYPLSALVVALGYEREIERERGERMAGETRGVWKGESGESRAWECLRSLG